MFKTPKNKLSINRVCSFSLAVVFLDGIEETRRLVKRQLREIVECLAQLSCPLLSFEVQTVAQWFDIFYRGAFLFGCNFTIANL